MFSKLFRGCREDSSRIPSSNKLQQTLEMLEEKEEVLQKKISIEVTRAKEFTKAKNKQAAIQCLKRKRFYEVQIEQLWDFQLRIHDQEQKLPQAEKMASNVKNNFEKSKIGGFVGLPLKEMSPSGGSR